jgi:CubicO group peptidase (beta-lactamase class C family)
LRVEPITDGLASRLEAKAASFVKDNRLPGAAVGVVHRDALVWSAGVGFADVASRRRPETTTLYRIASITKTFTGTAIMLLRDEGKLELDDPVGKHIPEVAHLEGVTIRRLLSHESGLQSEPPGTDWRRGRYEGSIAKNLARAADITTRVPPNTQQKYSNIGFQLLGEVVTRRSGMPYADYIRTQILDPLGMTSSGFEPLPAALASRRASGYAGRFVSDQLAPSSSPPGIQAEGGLWSCVDDLARWISYQFRDHATLREMHRPRYIEDEAWTEAYGIAWAALRRNDVVWIGHSGGLHGFRSHVCFDPKLEFGAIALINGVGDAPTLSIELAEIAREAIAAEPPRIDVPEPTPEAYRALIGVYFDAELGVTLRVEWRDARLTIVDPQLPAWRPTLTPTDDPDVFLIDPGYRQSGENAVFARLPDGRVASVFVAAGTWVRLEPVEALQPVPQL